ALVVILAAQLMVVLDFSIVNVALPSIQRDLGFSPGGLQWVVTAYSIAFGGLLMLGGRAGDVLGRRRLFLTGLAAFSIASLAGGMSRSAGMLVAARAAQGVGAAVVAPTALALLATSATATLAYLPVAGTTDGWGSVRFVAAALLAAVLLVAFVRWERSHANPLVRLGILRLRALRAANVVTLLFGAWNGGEVLI